MLLFFIRNLIDVQKSEYLFRQENCKVLDSRVRGNDIYRALFTLALKHRDI